MDAKIKIKELHEDISVISLSSLLFGLIYVSGYLITALYVRSRGIAPLPMLKAQYIETGLVFVILTGLLAGIPILIGQMAIHGRLKHGQRITPTIVIPIFATTNFLVVFLFWAIFVTEYEWESGAHLFGMVLLVKYVFPIYLASMLVFLPALAIIRMADFSQKGFLFFPRLKPDIDNTLKSKRVNAVIQVLRAVVVLVTLAFDTVLLAAIPWLPRFIVMVLYYLATVVFLIGGVYLVRYLSGIFGESSRRIAVWAVGVPLLLSCYYFCAIAYSYVVYNNIPVSRGGKYPTTKAVFTYPSGACEGMPTEAYILEESENTLYVIPTTVANWFTSHEDVIAVSRSEVSYRLVHLSTGEPRINHLRNGRAGAPNQKP